MKRIPVHSSQWAIVDDEDYAEMSGYKWRMDRYGYARRNINYKDGDKWKVKTVCMHRDIVSAKKGEIVDHINRDKLDNRRENLRKVNKLQNSQNRNKAINCSSPYLGVSWNTRRGLWVAFCKRKYIGAFVDETEAAMAFNKRAIELYGEYASLNKIEDNTTARLQTANVKIQ